MFEDDANKEKKHFIIIEPEKEQENKLQLIDNNNKDNESDKVILPLLILQGITILPGTIIPINIDSQKDKKMMQDYCNRNQKVVFNAYKSKKKEFVKEKLFPFGTYGKILKIIDINLYENKVIAILQGIGRMMLLDILPSKSGTLHAKVQLLGEGSIQDLKKMEALASLLLTTALKIFKLLPDSSNEIIHNLKRIKNPNFLIYCIASNLIDFKKKQHILSLSFPFLRGKKLLSYLQESLSFLEERRKLEKSFHKKIDQESKKVRIRQQIDFLQSQLGDDCSESEELLKRAKKKKWKKEKIQHFKKEVKKIQRMHGNSADYAMQINYLEYILNLPWNTFSQNKNKYDLKKVREELDKTLFGMEESKDTLMDSVCLQQRKLQGRILCLVGPPGVGKTTIPHCLANAIGKKCGKIALAGMTSKEDFYGHRRTYVGAMPGIFIKEISRLGVIDPIIILDEIDKLDSRHGMISSVLLEFLDTEYNKSIRDHYVEIPFDFSYVFFIATANDRNKIPYVLRDRMEILELEGYSLEEKNKIARHFILEKKRKKYKLTEEDISIEEEGLSYLIDNYTRESGVRELSRNIDKLCRKIIRHKLENDTTINHLTIDNIKTLLGYPTIDPEIYKPIKLPGISVGLFWSRIGGGILFIESSLALGKGKITISGQIGKVMEESLKAAHFYIRANAETFNIDIDIFQKYDLHLHIPDGATPKDGPSAGISILVSMVSAYTKKVVKPYIAMSGEITLQGIISPVGGIKEKILSAKRASIKQVYLSSKNKKDVDKIPDEYIKDIKICYCDYVTDLLPKVIDLS